MGEAKRRSALAVPDQRRAELRNTFDTLGIDVGRPGFYDETAFVEQEGSNRLFLERYGEWVMVRERDAAYDEHVRATLRTLSPIISDRLDRHRWFGACFAITAMLTRMLDRLGVWNAVMHGSASVALAKSLRNFAIVDNDEGEGYRTGHAWIVAPPYDIVDLTLHHQRWRPGDGRFQERAPKAVMEAAAKVVRPRARDVIAPELLVDGTDDEMFSRLPDQRRFAQLFPARQVIRNGLDIRYVASGMNAPLEQLEGINTDARAGVPAIRIWEEDVAPAFGIR